jgi:hypothetical protein
MAKSFSVPPKAANLLALSLAIRASRPSLTRAVFSLIPVNSAALANNVSSMFKVVLMMSSDKTQYYMYSYVLIIHLSRGIVILRPKEAMKKKLVAWHSCPAFEKLSSYGLIEEHPFFGGE